MSASSTATDAGDFDPRNLNSLLTNREQEELITLLTKALRSFRLDVELGFNEYKPYTQSSVELSRKSASTLAQQSSDLTEPRLRKLKHDALAYFDGWQDSVKAQVRDVLKAKTDTIGTQAPASIIPEDNNIASVENDGSLQKAYEPISTVLSTISHEKKKAIINSLLATILALGKYTAHSRVLLLILTSSLLLPVSILESAETRVAQVLIQSAKEMSADEQTKNRAKQNEPSRMWKVGLASVAGAALVGVTGGLAAPIVASGIGAIMGSVGLGAAASVLGVFTMSSAFMGALFGVIGGQMTGKLMDSYAKEVQDFKFLPVRGNQEDSHETNDIQDSEIRRLRVTIGVSGWLLKESDIVTPWKVLGPEAEVFALRYELAAMMDLGNTLKSMVQSRV
jgi:hypothetical protein